MIKRPPSRDSYTHFPAGNQSTSSNTSERMGAFGTMQLEEVPRAHNSLRPPYTHQRSHSQPQPSYSHENYQQYGPNTPRRTSTYSHEPVARPQQLPEERDEIIYQPTVSIADTTETRRKYDKLSEVYSTSGDTVEFARNFNSYLNEKIPYGVTIAVMVMLSIVAFALSIVGTLNLPYCPVQPLIPIWLMVAGFLFIVSAGFRIFRHIPAPPRKRRGQRLSADLCCTGLELLFLFINLIWLILGCVWVYGSKSYVHFQDHMFEEHFCDEGLFWTAFSAVTAYLIFVCVVMLALICLLFVGSFKEAQSQDLE